MPCAYYNKIFVLSDSAALYAITFYDTLYMVLIPQCLDTVVDKTHGTSRRRHQ